jgi:hypothetical protein
MERVAIDLNDSENTVPDNDEVRFEPLVVLPSA